METELTLASIIKKAMDSLPRPGLSRIPEDASQRVLKATEACLMLVVGGEEKTETSVERASIRSLLAKAEIALRAAVMADTSFESDDLKQWEYNHSTAELQRLWEFALELVTSTVVSEKGSLPPIQPFDGTASVVPSPRDPATHEQVAAEISPPNGQLGLSSQQ